MIQLRVPVASVCLAVAAYVGAPAYAQSARVEDIQVSRSGETISILVKLSQQPAAASAKSVGNDLLVEIDGVDLTRLVLDPPAGSLVRHVDAAGRKMTLSGAAFGEASTVIYRNAVLIEAKLAEPKLRGGSSLMASVAPTPAPASTSAATPPPMAKPVAVAPPPPLKTPAPEKLPAKAPEPSNGLESQPAPVLVSAPAVSKPKASITGMANIDTARCTAAAHDVEKDPWAIAALGDHALCLLDQGKTREAGNRLEQLAAFAPEDWRVALGRAALAAEKGDASNAEIGYRTAALLAPDEHVRAAITSKLAPAAGQQGSVTP
jgi:hypothetical protein